LVRASRDGKPDEVKALLAKGADPNAAYGDGRLESTALKYAVQHGHVDIVKELLAAKADPRKTGSHKHSISALLQARLKDNSEMLKLLTDAGKPLVDAQVKTFLEAEHASRDSSVIVHASSYGFDDAVNKLIEAKADVNAFTTGDCNATGLISAAFHGHTEVAKILTEANANVNAARDGGDTALMDASYGGHLEIAKILIAANANVDTARHDGSTALMAASSAGHTEVAKILIAANANVKARNASKVSALAFALSQEHTDVATALSKAGALLYDLAEPYTFELCLSHARTLDEEALSLIAAQTLAAQKSLATDGAAEERASGEYREGLSLLLRIVECAMKHARTERASDPAAADGCIALAMRLQLIAAAYLKEADGDSVSDILNGSEALSIALRCEAKVFIMQPVVQQWLRWKWFPRSQARGKYPSEKVPAVVKFAFAIILDLALALIITLSNASTLARPIIAYPLLVWTVSGVAWELRQLAVAVAAKVDAVKDEGLGAEKDRSDADKAKESAWWAPRSAVGQRWQRQRKADLAVMRVINGIAGYWSDRFNRVDALAMLVTIAALVSAIINDASPTDGFAIINDASPTDGFAVQPSSATRIASSCAAALLWGRMLRVLLILPKKGPYVLMVFRMMDDVFNFVVILFFFILVFSAAFSKLYEPDPSTRNLPSPLPSSWPLASSDASCVDYFASWDVGIVYLIENSVTGGDFFECVRNTPEVAITAWILSLVYFFFVALLLLNMLIAMMAKTFDNVAEAQAMNYTFLMAQMTVTIDQQPPTPPPLYVLKIPYDCVNALRWLGLFPLPSGWKEDTDPITGKTIYLGPNEEKWSKRPLPFPTPLDCVRMVCGRTSRVGSTPPPTGEKNADERAMEETQGAENDPEGGAEKEVTAVGTAQPADLEEAKEAIVYPDERPQAKARWRNIRAKLKEELQVKKLSKLERQQKLAKSLTSYIEEHQDEVAQEERWRIVMMEKISAKFKKAEEKQDEKLKKLEDVILRKLDAAISKMSEYDRQLYA